MPRPAPASATDALPPAALAALFHHRWAVPVLAELSEQRGCKVVWLTHRLGAARQPVRDALDALAGLRLVEPNPGYGHPLRPEWILTPRGERAGPACVALMRVLTRLDAADVALRKWSVPTLAAMHAGAGRFAQLARSLPDATDRALSMTLGALAQRSLITKLWAGRRGPDPHATTATRAGYRLTPSGRAVARAVINLRL